MTTTTTLTDPFDTPDFAPERVSLPWLQVLHNEDPEKAGLFITLDNAETADIQVPFSWRKFKARFKSGEADRATGKFIPATAEGYLFDEARMIVLRSGALSMFTKRSANGTESYLGRYDYQVYQEQRSDLVLKTKHLIYLLSDNNQLLHESPMQFTTRGVFGATFAEHLKEFQSELQKAYGKKRGQKFLINGVLTIRTASEMRGNPPDTAWVTIVDSHVTPTKDNWLQDCFVGYNDSLREKLLADYEAFANFDAKGRPEEEKPAVDPETGEILNSDLLESTMPEPNDHDVPW